LGDDAEQASRQYLLDYYRFVGDFASQIARSAHRSVSQLRDTAKGFEDAGFTEFYFDPTAATLDQIDRLAEAVLADPVQQHLTFIDAAVDAGVQRIVYVSFFGASPTATFTLARHHWATEEHLCSVGITHTILRDNIYADFTPHFLGTDGNIRGPAGDGRVALVAMADVAEVAIAVLTSDGAYDGQTLNLTGPAALTMREIASALSDHLGRTVSYIPETMDEAYASRAPYGAPEWQVEGWVSTYLAIAAGELAAVRDDISEMTGHPAMSLQEALAAADH
jgi:NAD(P)H dehydrogenase (quinone)